MHRRDFLKAGAALLSTSETGCASGQHPASPAPLPDLDATLARMDRDLARIDNHNVLGHFSALAPPALLLRELGPRGPLLRSSVKALYLTGAFGDLPLEAQLHPGVQARLWSAAPQLDEAVLGMQGYLTSLSDAELQAVRDAMRADPLLLPKVVECLDAASAEAEIQPERRLKMRSLMKTLGWRMQHQSPRAVIGEYTDKMQRMAARDGSQAEQERRIAARMTEQGFFEYREKVEAIALRWQVQLAGAGGGGPASKRLTLGLQMLGFGALGFAVGGVLLLVGSASIPVAVIGSLLTTIGGIAIIAGMVTAIISAIILATRGDTPATADNDNERVSE